MGSELHGDRFAIGVGGFEELALLEAEHPRQMLVGNDWILVFRSRTTAL